MGRSGKKSPKFGPVIPRSRAKMVTDYQPPGAFRDQEFGVITDGKESFGLISYKFASPDSLISNNLEKKLEANTCTSYIQVNNYVFLVGGSAGEGRLAKVQIYNLQSRKWLAEAPPLNSPKSGPTLVTIGTKLFAFSSMLSHIDGSSYWLLESEPRAEVLDVASIEHSDCKWEALPPPDLPPFHTFGLTLYAIIGHASSSDGLFLSLAGSGCYTEGVCSLSYNDVTGKWGFSSTPLPFYGKAPFHDDVYFGFPSNEKKRDFICSYKIEWDDSDNFKFVELGYFPIVSGSHLTDRPYIRSLIPLERNIVCLVQAHVEGPYDLPVFQAHYVGVDVIRVAKKRERDDDNDEEEGDKDEQPQLWSSNLLWHKSYGRKWPIHDIVGITLEGNH